MLIQIRKKGPLLIGLGKLPKLVFHYNIIIVCERLCVCL